MQWASHNSESIVTAAQDGKLMVPQMAWRSIVYEPQGVCAGLGCNGWVQDQRDELAVFMGDDLVGGNHTVPFVGQTPHPNYVQRVGT